MAITSSWWWGLVLRCNGQEAKHMPTVRTTSGRCVVVELWALATRTATPAQLTITSMRTRNAVFTQARKSSKTKKARESRETQFERRRVAEWWWEPRTWAACRVFTTAQVTITSMRTRYTTQPTRRRGSQVKHRATREIAYKNHPIQYLAAAAAWTGTGHPRVWPAGGV